MLDKRLGWDLSLSGFSLSDLSQSFGSRFGLGFAFWLCLVFGLGLGLCELEVVFWFI